MSIEQLPFDPGSLVIGLALGFVLAFFEWKRRSSTGPRQIRELNTRLISQNMQLDRATRELDDIKGVVTRLLDERKDARSGYPYGSPEDVESSDSDPLRLTMVAGIGPKLAITLASYGVTDLARLALISDHEMALIESSAPALADRMSREGWKQQAVRLLESPPPDPDSENHLGPTSTSAFVDTLDVSKFRESNAIPPTNGSSGPRH